MKSADIDSYIATFPKDVQVLLRRSAAPSARPRPKPPKSSATTSRPSGSTACWCISRVQEPRRALSTGARQRGTRRRRWRNTPAEGQSQVSLRRALASGSDCPHRPAQGETGRQPWRAHKEELAGRKFNELHVDHYAADSRFVRRHVGLPSRSAAASASPGSRVIPTASQKERARPKAPCSRCSDSCWPSRFPAPRRDSRNGAGSSTPRPMRSAPPICASTCFRKRRRRRCAICSAVTSISVPRSIKNAKIQEDVEASHRRGVGTADRDLETGHGGVRLPGASPQATMLLTPALNEMIDITATRRWPREIIRPSSSSCCSPCSRLVGALLVGYGTSTNKDRSWFHHVTFALVISLAIYVIVDLEYPRLGLIKVDSADQALLDVGASMR